MTHTEIASDATRVFPPELDKSYPVAVHGEGVWLQDADGERYLDAMSGGSMAAPLGYGRIDIVRAAREQAQALPFVHNERLTNPAQERLARTLVEIAPPGFTRASFVTGGAEANEAALRLARSYHVERGDPGRWRVISPAQAYHGPTVATLGLTARPGLYGPLDRYLPPTLHIPPSTRQLDPTGERALEALDRVLAQAGPESVAAFFCEGVSAAALPAYTPPARFWEGLAQRREEHGFLVCFDEIVTGVGRTGTWFAADQLPITPDIIATAKGLGSGYAPIGAVLARSHVYDAIAAGSGSLPLGHTWSGAPLLCAVGEKVVQVMRDERLVERVAERGPRLRDELEAALAGISIVREVRGHGYLLGVEYGDPRDEGTFLAPELGVAGRVDAAAMQRRLITLSTQPTGDGYAGDQSLFAPAFVASDEELAEMVARFADAVAAVAADVEPQLAARAGGAT